MAIGSKTIRTQQLGLSRWFDIGRINGTISVALPKLD